MRRDWGLICKRAIQTSMVGAGVLMLLASSLRADTSDSLLPEGATTTTSNGEARIDVVFAIDCSGSMGPVIETAKRKVWTIVNEIAKAKPAPVLRIGLIGYGDADRTFRVFPLSDDLDTVYKNLMTFKDEGWGDEYVGLAVHKATSEMAWSQSITTTLKVIYVLGNETARQGPAEFDYAKTSPLAAKSDIIVNAIYCNAGNGGGVRINPAPTAANPAKPSVTPVAPQQMQQIQGGQLASVPSLNNETRTWMEMSTLGKGKFLEIFGDGGTVSIPTPFDADIIKLNNSLNATYIPYGSAGMAGYANQKAQDSNASTVGGAGTMAYRAQSKGSKLYNNRGWDLVDASREKDFNWSKVKAEDLPANMKGKTVEEWKKQVEESAKQRGDLQIQIRGLGDKREAFIQNELKKQNVNNKNAFDEAVRKSITEQGQAKGFVFE